MMLRLAVLVISVSLPLQASALSCLAPNPAQAFNAAHASEKTYIMVHGSLKPDGAIPEVPPIQMDQQHIERPPIRASYTFTGRSIGPFSMGDQQTRQVEVSVSCLGVWCGGFPQAIQDGVFFFEKSPQAGLSLAINACPRGYINAPVPKGLVAVLQKCFRNGVCTDTDIEKFSLY